MKTLLETGWSGWNPSANIKGTPDGQNQQLLRMDNLTQEEQGVLRLARYSAAAANDFNGGNIYSIFSTVLNSIQTRFVYTDYAAQKTVVCSLLDPTNLEHNLVIQTEDSTRCDFLNTLGQVFMVAGGIQQKWDGVNSFPIGVPAPAPPTLMANATPTVDLSNLDGSGNYTNWTAVADTTYDNTGTDINGTAAPTPSLIANAFSFTTTYGSPVDTTDLSGAGNDTPDDLFTYQFSIDDQTQIVWAHVTLYTDTGNYYWFEWDFSKPSNTTYPPFNVTSGIITPVQLARSAFYSVGAPDWASIATVSFQFGISGDATLTWSDYEVSGGKLSSLTGSFNYIAVQVNNTGTFLEFSPSSIIVSTTVNQASVTITADGALDAQANEYWLFRQDPTGGNYYLIAKQAGVRGFTPTPYTDISALADILAAANVNPYNTLQYYRQPLPAKLVSMLWFRDRIIYLTKDSFIPSFNLDPGSYDSRFVYQLAGDTSEQCLFIVKLNVGLFIVATTKDFYQVSGTFAIQIDPNDPTGQTMFQDVTITPLGIADPAVSRVFVEFQQTIIYVSATGVRVLNNATSTLINDNIELLFRNESRFGLPAIKLLPNDASIIAAASRGTLIYFSFPHTDGINRLYVLNIANQSNAAVLNTRSWRLLNAGATDNSTNFMSLFREDNGMVIGGGPIAPTNYVRAIGEDTSGQFPVYLLTQFNYNGNPMTRKDSLIFKTYINTGGQLGSLTIYGLMRDGSTTSFDTSIYSTSLMEFSIDIKAKIGSALAYAIKLTCLTAVFELQWFSISYEERPAPVMRAIIFPNNLDKPSPKEISVWPFMYDPLNANLVIYTTVDGVRQLPQFAGGVDSGPQTAYWFNTGQTPKGTDWGIEIFSKDHEFEFYKFFPPLIQQIYPIPRLVDLLGPFDLNAKGLVFGARVRVSSAGFVDYFIYADDDLVCNDTIQCNEKDQVYEIKFPKGINPTVLKVTLKGGYVFYRFSVELKVRKTGKETEEMYIMVADVNSK